MSSKCWGTKTRMNQSRSPMERITTARTKTKSTEVSNQAAADNSRLLHCMLFGRILEPIFILLAGFGCPENRTVVSFDNSSLFLQDRSSPIDIVLRHVPRLWILS